MTDRPTRPTADSTVTEEAAAWLLRVHGVHARQCSDEEQAQFQAWLQADPAHAREYEALLEVWTISGSLAPTLETDSTRGDDSSVEVEAAVSRTGSS